MNKIIVFKLEKLRDALNYFPYIEYIIEPWLVSVISNKPEIFYNEVLILINDFEGNKSNEEMNEIYIWIETCLTLLRSDLLTLLTEFKKYNLNLDDCILNITYFSKNTGVLEIKPKYINSQLNK